MFRYVKRTGRGLNLTGRENGLCQGNRSIKWHSELRAYYKVQCPRIVNIKAVVEDEPGEVGRGQITENPEYRDGKMPKV